MSKPKVLSEEERVARERARYAAQYAKNKEKRLGQMKEYNLRTAEEQKVKRSERKAK